MNKKYILNALFFMLLCFLFVPLFQMITEIKEVKPLKGDVELTPRTKFSLNSWFNGFYQDSTDKYFNDNIGFRPWLVKLRNQISFSVFDIMNAKDVIRGKENYLYEVNYIKAYNGDDFIGLDSIDFKVKQIKYLQDKLESLGKTLIVYLAPGKGSFYPEYFPDAYTKPITDKTNYKQYSKSLKLNNVNTIDCNKWFLSMKDTCNCMLYPKYGIHWSYFGMVKAADSLIKYIEQKRNIRMPQIQITHTEKSIRVQPGDYDIGDGLNLLFQLNSDTMCYPKIKWVSDKGTIKPKVIVIGDSFYWSMYDMGICTNSFSLGGFWYYNNEVYPESHDKKVYVHQVDLNQKIKETDVFILMVTEANLSKFSWGFVEKAKNAEVK